MFEPIPRSRAVQPFCRECECTGHFTSAHLCIPSDSDLRMIGSGLLEGWERARRSLEAPTVWGSYYSPVHPAIPYADVRDGLDGYTDDRNQARRIALSLARDTQGWEFRWL
jgi:hypothetical protein